MAVGGISSAGEKNPTPKRAAPDSSTLQMDDFMKLLSVQLQNQDMNSPMSNSEMMGQLTSMATVQSMNTFSELSSTQYALNLIGQNVQVTDIDPLTNKMTMLEGKVSGINLSNMTFYLEDSTKAYGLGNVMEVGTVKKDPNDADADGIPDKPVEGEDDTTTPPEGGDDNKPEGPGDGSNKPEEPGGGDNKPEKPGGGDNKPDGSGDGSGENNKSRSAFSGSRAAAQAAPDGRMAAPDTKAVSPGTAAARSSIATLPDGRTSTPVGRTASDSRDVTASSTGTENSRAMASTSAVTGARAMTTGSKTESSGRRSAAPGGRADTPGMPQDKVDALARQAARTIPEDKAASLERDRIYRSRVTHIGPGSWT